MRIAGDEALVDDTFARFYDLASAGLSAARFVLADGLGSAPPGVNSGFDLDAIGAICTTPENTDRCWHHDPV